MRKKKLMMFGCAVLSAAVIAGCGSKAGAETSTAAAAQETTQETEAAADQRVSAPEAETASDKAEETITVQVTSVEDGTVTAQVGELKEKSGGPDGQAPDGEKPDGDHAPNGQKPEDSKDGSAPSGEKPDGQPQGGPDGKGPGGEKHDGGQGEHDGDHAPNGQKPEDSKDGSAPNGEKPDGQPQGGQNGSAPGGEKPDGQPGNGQPGGGPDGQMPGGMPGGFGGSEFVASDETITFTVSDDTKVTVEYLQGTGEGTLKEIVAGGVLEVVLDADNHATEVVVKNLNAGGGFGGSGEVTNGTAANTIEEDKTVSGEKYASSGDDENALRIDGVTVTLDGVTIEKTGGESSNTEDGDFYGQNAAFLALNGADVTIKNATVNTSAVNGNGIFSYGEGTVVNISDSTIRTTERNSGGIQTTGGATMNARNLDIETQGNSAAAIRSDRGGGNVNVDGGTYVTNGTGSPAVYCTANIQVSNASLTANASEGVVVEGKNSVSLKNCDVTGDMKNTYNGDSEENIHNIMIYQSMSGDAEIGEAYFSAEGGSITAKTGDMFYITNTDCEVTLKDVSLNLANEVLFRIEGNNSSRGWGTKGANGGDVILTADSQSLTGNILVDSISSLNMTMKNASTMSGAINPDGEGGEVNLVLGSDCKWTLTGDSYITSLDGDLSNITANGYHLYINGEQAL